MLTIEERYARMMADLAFRENQKARFCTREVDDRNPDARGGQSTGLSARICAALSRGPLTGRDVVLMLGEGEHKLRRVRNTLYRMEKAGIAIRGKRDGQTVWELCDG